MGCFGSSNPNDLYKNTVGPGGSGQNISAINLDPTVLAQQNSFVQALQGQMAGTGPSVAGTMLKNQADQNNASTLATAASQRGVNPGMALRQAQQQNAVSNQQSGQTAATARAQEQLNATGQLGSQLNNMQGQNMQAQQATQGNNLAAAGINAGMAGTAASNNANVLNNVIGGVAKGVSAVGALLAHGGMVPHFAAGGDIAATPFSAGPSSGVGKYLQNYGSGDKSNSLAEGLEMSKKKKPDEEGKTSAIEGYGPGSQALAGGPGDAVAAPMPMGDPSAMFAAHGGQVPAMVSPGERYLSPKEVEKVAEGKKSAMKAGEKIPGKAKVSGAKDSYANDTVPKTLESGGIVLPRHITQAKDAPEKAAAFVRAVLAKQGLKR